MKKTTLGVKKNEMTAIIKPANYEKAKTRKYKSDIAKRENMPYDAATDSYRCHRGNILQAAYEKKTKAKAEYGVTTTVYSCTECKGCPYKDKCIKGSSKIPLEERKRV